MIDKPDLLTDAVNEAVLEKPSITGDMRAFVEAVSKKFIQKQLDDFPRMCDVARFVNLQKRKEYEKYGNKGQFTESYGWSKDGTMFDEFEIPEDLYHFMQNMVYKKFWDNENSRIWRPFMQKICSKHAPMTQYDAMNLLMKIKTYYGPNSDWSLT